MPAIQPAFVHPCVFVHLRANEYPLVRTDRGCVQCIDDIPATEKYIYIYITGAYSYLLPHPWRTICAVLPYPLSALTKLTLSSFSRGRGLVANPDSNRDPREFPWSFTRCAMIVPRSNFLSFFFPVIAKFFSYYFHFLKIFIWKKMWQSVSLIWRFEFVGCRLPADLSRKRDMIHRRKFLSPKNCTSTGIFVNYYI